MSVDIDPLELGFKRPFTSEGSQILRIRNTNQSPVAFKVKTTAPKLYCVRPNSGRIDPGNEVEVTVLLQAMKEEPPLSTVCKDKFLVQSIVVPESNEPYTGGSPWPIPDGVEKTDLHETKIKVAYLPPMLGPESTAESTDTPVKSNVNGVKSIESEGASPAQNTYHSTSPQIVYSSDNRSTNRQTFGIPNSRDAANPPPYSIVSNTSPSFDEKVAKYPVTEEAVAKLQDGLRRRKLSNKNESNQATRYLEQDLHHGSQGVPLQVVAVLCLTSFLLGYLLF